MNQYRLAQISERAARKAHRVRHEEDPRPDSEQIARAWERLADAADCLHAIYARQQSFKAGPPQDVANPGE